jgi:hypothetical protein
MIYACSGWELVEDTYLFKLPRLQNTVLRIIDKFRGYTPVRDLRTAFKQWAEVLQNHENEYVRRIQ